MGKILLVDDDAATRLAVSRILRDAGHLVELAKDGRDCLGRKSAFEGARGG